MKIKTRLRLNALIGIAAAIVVALPLVWSYREMSQADRNQHQVIEMRKIALERQVLRDEYLLFGDERIRFEWVSKTNRFRALLKQAGERLAFRQEKEPLEEIGRNFETTFVIFSRIMEERSRGILPPGKRNQVDQLKLAASSLTTDLGKLVETLGKISEDARKRTIRLLVLFIAMGFIVTVGNSALINRTLSRRLEELREGTVIIGNGNLDHRLTASGDDELTELALMTNEMAATLQNSFTSVKNLEREIEARNEAERTARQSEQEKEQYKKFFMLSNDAMCIADPFGCFKSVNPTLLQMTGYSKNEVLSKPFLEFVAPEDRQRTAAEMELQVSTRSSLNFENRYLHKDGSTLLLSWNAYFDSKDGVTYATARDITEQRSLENQLRQVQKIEAVGTLAGGIAHDFNNILSVIIGFGSILDMKMAKDDPLHDNVAQILVAADRAANLTRSMLAFSRKQTMEIKPLKLNELISGLEKMLRRLIREDIELRLCLTEDEVTVLADAGQLEQVLLNLTTNAKDSIPERGSITITTELTELDATFSKDHGYGEPGWYVLITFADSGKGMEECVRQKIFEPFFTTKEVGKGTGLGLSVCYGIIKQHNGYILCASEPGRGTTFRIYLPLSRSSALVESVKESDIPENGTETILLAEDDRSLRALATSILTECGYTVIEAENGEEAMSKFAERPDEIKLCLFDVIMPKRSGIETYQEIKRVRPGMKVLFMSGYQPNISRQDERVDLITKPVSPRELLKRVREVLDRRSS